MLIIWFFSHKTIYIVVDEFLSWTTLSELHHTFIVMSDCELWIGKCEEEIDHTIF